MNISKNSKMQKNEVMDFDSIFDGDDSEDLKFEEMVINSDVMAVVKNLMKLNKITTNADLASKLNVTPAYISKLFSGDKKFNVTLLAKMQRIFNTRFEINAKSLIKKELIGHTVESTSRSTIYNQFTGTTLEVYVNPMYNNFESELVVETCFSDRIPA